MRLAFSLSARNLAQHFLAALPILLVLQLLIEESRPLQVCNFCDPAQEHELTSSPREADSNRWRARDLM